MKLGRTFPTVRRALERSGRLAEARYVERATMAGERTGRLADVDPDVGAVLLAVARRCPQRRGRHARRADAAGTGRRTAASPARARGRRGRRWSAPARPGPLWLTPEARGALAAADDLVGYTTYLDRVPRAPRPAPPRLRQQGRGRARRIRPRPGPARPPGGRGLLAATPASSPWPPPCWRSPSEDPYARRPRTGAARA